MVDERQDTAAIEKERADFEAKVETATALGADALIVALWEIEALHENEYPWLTLSAEEVAVARAALCAMTQDVHAPQDTLTAAQWALADRLYERLTRFVEGSDLLSGVD